MLTALLFASIAFARVPYLDPCGYPPAGSIMLGKESSSLSSEPCLAEEARWKIPLLTRLGDKPGGVYTYGIVQVRTAKNHVFFLERIPTGKIVDVVELPLAGRYVSNPANCQSEHDLARIGFVEGAFSLFGMPYTPSKAWRVDTDLEKLVEASPPAMSCQAPTLE